MHFLPYTIKAPPKSSGMNLKGSAKQQLKDPEQFFCEAESLSHPPLTLTSMSAHLDLSVRSVSQGRLDDSVS